MEQSKKMAVAVIVAVLFVGIGIGLAVAHNGSTTAQADDLSHIATTDSAKVDQPTLDGLFQAAFGRPVDVEGEQSHLGKDLTTVLHDINNSDERKFYSALTKSVKAYEQAIRAPGVLSDADKQIFLNNINTALSTLIAWVETLPKQDICQGVVGAAEARQAIQNAFTSMSPAAQAVAKQGIFNALQHFGQPIEQDLPSIRCLTPTPSMTPTPSPAM